MEKVVSAIIIKFENSKFTYGIYSCCSWRQEFAVGAQDDKMLEDQRSQLINSFTCFCRTDHYCLKIRYYD